jgi:hypothetical protein
MTILTHEEIAKIGIRVRGAIKIPPDTAHPSGQHIVIQGATEENANAHDATNKPIVIYPYHLQEPSRTALQAARRNLLADAVAFYRTLSTIDKAAYKPEAARRKITVWNQVMSDYMNTHIARTESEWDDGMTIWDTGASIWDSTESIPWDSNTAIWDGGISHWPE